MSKKSFQRKSILLEAIKPDCDWKKWHDNNFVKIQNNKFEDKQWVQPSCDHRTYKYLELNNGIKVLLIYDNKQERKSFEQGMDQKSDSDIEMANDIDASSNNDKDKEKEQQVLIDGNNYYDVSLCVNRGYYADFPDCPGIAHYCEHMLFMGNEKYPKENDWEDWLSLKGGSANATTYNLLTNYVFDIAPKGKELLFEALDRFAHNFISPLFNPESSERELNAIENEFNFCKTDDAFKQWLCLKRHVLKSDDIPYYKFGSGNKNTLDKEDINDRLIEYWTQNYLPSNMSLCILSDVDLNELEKYVTDLFEQITIPKGYKPEQKEKDESSEEDKENKMETDHDIDMNKTNPLRLEPNLLKPIYGKLFRVNAVKELYTLDIYWMLNGKECSKYYDSSPCCLISELLGHEGKGSLHQVLNDRNYINSLECGYDGNSEGLNKDFTLFEMNLDLTEKGYDEVYEIVDYVFQYLAMLKHELLCIVNENNNDNIKRKGKNGDNTNDMKNYWNEAKRLGDIAFNFSNKTDGWDLVEDLSTKLHLYPVQHLLSADYLYWKYDPVLTLNALKELTVDRCCMMLLAIDAIDYKHKIKDNNIPPIQDRQSEIEPILDTKYTLEDIPKCYMDKWKKYMDNNEYDDNLIHLPNKNTFVPTDLKLLSDDTFNENELFQHFLDIEKIEHCGPELVVYNENMKLYYKLDRTYFLPKSYITMVFEHHLIAEEDAKNLTALEIFIDMFIQYSSSDVYLATLSGLDFSLDRSWRGLKFKVYGYHHKLWSYFQQLLTQIKTFKLDQELFETQKNAHIRELKNAIVDCEDHLPYIARKCISYKATTIEKELNAANNITLTDIENVRDLLFTKHGNDLRIYGLITGNIEPNIVNHCSKYLMDIFNLKKTNDDNNGKLPMYNKYKSLLNENKFLSQSDQQSIRKLFSKCIFQPVNLPKNTISVCSEICVSEDEENQGALVVFQMGDKPVDNNAELGMGILCALMRSLLNEPFYDQLRTKQQLGYEVNVSYETVGNIPWIKFQVISSQYDPHYLTLQILKFINNIFYDEYILDILQKNEFEKIKDKIDSHIRSRKIECQQLSSRHNSYWAEIFTYNSLEFDAKLLEVKALKSFNFQRIKQLYEDKLLFKNENTQCLICQVWKQETNTNDTEQKSPEKSTNHSTTENSTLSPSTSNGTMTQSVSISPQKSSSADVIDQNTEIVNIQNLDQLKQQLLIDLDLSQLCLKEIEDILSWQNKCDLLSSYL